MKWNYILQDNDEEAKIDDDFIPLGDLFVEHADSVPLVNDDDDDEKEEFSRFSGNKTLQEVSSGITGFSLNISRPLELISFTFSFEIMKKINHDWFLACIAMISVYYKLQWNGGCIQKSACCLDPVSS